MIPPASKIQFDLQALQNVQKAHASPKEAVSSGALETEVNSSEIQSDSERKNLRTDLTSEDNASLKHDVALVRHLTTHGRFSL